MAAVMGDKEFENFTKHIQRKESKPEEQVDQPTKRQLQGGLFLSFITSEIMQENTEDLDWRLGVNPFDQK